MAPQLKGPVMLDNSYAGIVEQEVPRLVVSRARRMGIGRDEIDDLQQQIVPKLAAFQYDGSRSNGASRTTALTSVIDRQLKAHLRAKHRYRKRIERLQTMSCPSAWERPVWPQHVTQPEPVDLRMDLADAMDMLSDRERTICAALREGQTIKAIAQQIGCGRDTVSRAILHIRQVFTQTGLRVWIDADYSPQPAQA